MRLLHRLRHLIGFEPCRIGHADSNGHTYLVTQCTICEEIKILDHSSTCDCFAYKNYITRDKNPKFEGDLS